MDDNLNLLSRGIVNIIPNKDLLAKKLTSGEKLNVYLGIDPTATRIHLGHAVPLRILQKFAEMGHNVTFLIGDFTALIGDTSDKDTERPILTSDQIEQNFKTYKEQASKILDFSKVKVTHNSEWLSKLTFAEIVKLCQSFSFGEFASRELIKKRLTEGKKVGLHEAIYPVMQGYDSYFMDTDIQIGGADQTFNMQAGRVLQKDLRDKESFVLATGYLTGTDGRKMSKSWGNAIWLDDTPSDMFGKIMSIEDNLIIEYFTLATSVPNEKIQEVVERLASKNPMILKKELAVRIVSELYSTEDALKASEEFQKTVQNKELPDNLVEYEVKSPTLILDFLIENNLVESKSDAKRLFQGGAIKFEKTPSQYESIIIKSGILEYGKRKAVKLNFTGK